MRTPGARPGTRYRDGDELPRELVAAFAAAPEARERFDAMPPSHRREYVRWIAEGRRDDTRERRAAQTVMRVLEHRPAPAGGTEAGDAITGDDSGAPDA